MIIKDDILFHNVNEMLFSDVVGGEQLIRVPTTIIEQMNARKAPSGKFMLRERYKKPAGSELRYVMEEEFVLLTIYSSDRNCPVSIFYGDILAKNIFLNEGYNIIKTQIPERVKLLNQSKKYGRFTPNVVRVCFLGVADVNIWYVGKQGKTRTPLPEEMPEKRMLAYGTSITQGYSGCFQPLTYISQVARNMEMDLFNLGIGGGAFCEKVVAEWICSCEWDIASLCISVNMVNSGMELEDYANRIREFVEMIQTKNPEKHIFCISPYTFFGDMDELKSLRKYSEHPDKFRASLELTVSNIDSPYVHYINGRDLLTDISKLTPDFIHPSDMGMIEIANNLSKKMKELM